jgi:hypothetical protein
MNPFLRRKGVDQPGVGDVEGFSLLHAPMIEGQVPRWNGKCPN